MARKENTFIGVFNSQREVVSKVRELKAQGYQESDMYVVGQDRDAFSTVQNQTDVHVDAAGQQQDQGFMGKFMSALSGESSSMDAFSGMGLNRAESEEYYRQVQNGKLVLYVDSDYGDSYDRYRRSTGSDPATGTGAALGSGSTVDSTSQRDSTFGSTPETNRTSPRNDEERLRLHEEQLNVGKERVQTGEVNVGKRVVEENKTLEVPVEREEVYVERHPVNEEASGTKAFNENETINVPLSEERVNVSKQDVVTEEIVVGKQKVQDTERVDETVRREVADVDEDDNNLTNKNNRKPL
ncbi:YsnF/AvaK domain-containing protein [Planococcus sp. 1R117A]|uniref:YsnF/AvaK domain-containing protein n=1 Tax=Planococcus sp. 1R117A TaxID=3447020 RepID=UPI003EDB6C8F